MRNFLLGLMLAGPAIPAYNQTVGLNGDVGTTMFQGFVRSASGQLLDEVKNQELTDGSGFFKNAWLKGSAEFTNGAVCRNVPLKLNLLTHRLHYLEQGQEMVATSVVRRLWLTDTLTGQTFVFCHKWMVDSPGHHAVTWYQVLADGKAMLLLAHKKTVEEHTSYGSATVERTARTDKTWYLWLNGTLTEVKKWRHLPDYLTGKESKADAFIDKNGLTGKTEADWTKVVEWYNGG